ncbi:MAG TPA: CotH kinase family protein, partial [Candidatus Limnocylindrales bacterium]
AVAAIELTLPEASIAALEDPEKREKYQDGTFSLAMTDGTPAGVGEPSAPFDVGVRLKGGRGSFKPLTEKAAFKVKFNHSVKGQMFLGLKTLTLNNMVQDPSMLHEALSYEAFRAVGIAAPRTGYAYVRVNGEDYGLHLNVETLDDVALPRWFEATGHLYEGAYGSDVTPGGAAAFEVDEGDEDDVKDLEGLIAAANQEAGDWSDGMSGVADLLQMARMWAVERYVGHWDGYSGIEGVEWPNNFYLHSDAAGRFTMLPWGTDQTWTKTLPFESDAGLLFDRCLADASCATAYEGALVEVSEAIAELDLDARAVAISALLSPWQKIDPRLEYGAPEIAAAVEATRAFIAARPGELAAWLGRGDEVESEGEEEPVVESAPVPAQLVDSTLAGMQVGRSSVADGVLATRLDLPRPGRVVKRASIGTADGAVQACASRAEVRAAGGATLRCQLSAETRRRLQSRWLRIRIEIKFSPNGANPESITRTLIARRSPLA